MRSFADHGRGVNDGSGVNGWGVSRRLIEDAQGAREGQVGILEAKGCRGDFLELGLDQHGGSLGLPGQGGVAGIGHEGHLRGPSLLNPFHAGHFPLRVAAQLRAQPDCQLA